MSDRIRMIYIGRRMHSDNKLHYAYKCSDKSSEDHYANKIGNTVVIGCVHEATRTENV